jgi:hypothetical protein
MNQSVQPARALSNAAIFIVAKLEKVSEIAYGRICPTSALVRQIYRLEERRISGSS